MSVFKDVVEVSAAADEKRSTVLFFRMSRLRFFGTITTTDIFKGKSDKESPP